jgi:hypothetical protein
MLTIWIAAAVIAGIWYVKQRDETRQARAILKREQRIGAEAGEFLRRIREAKLRAEQ